jgi:hypothetical protein
MKRTKLKGAKNQLATPEIGDGHPRADEVGNEKPVAEAAEEEANPVSDDSDVQDASEED